MTEPKKVFIRPPDDWDTMSEQAQFDWALLLVEAIKEAAATDLEPPLPAPEE